MESTNTIYPVFEPDQVLTSEHLNQLRRFLAMEDRQSRRLLHGIGTVCGLQISNPSANVITISKGVGVTSQGFLVTLADSDCEYYRPYEDKVYTEVDCEGQITGKYDLFLKDDGTQYNLWELLTKNEEAEIDDNRIKLLSEAPMNMATMYIILYLEIEDLDMLACFGDDCDEKGIQRTFKARKLLIQKADLLEIIKKAHEYGEDLTQTDLEEDLNAKYNLKPVSLKRLGYDFSTDAKTLSLSEYHSPDTLFQNYESIIEQGTMDVGLALHGTYEAYKMVLQDLYPENPFESFDAATPDSNELHYQVFAAINDDKDNIQYAYDFLDDLVAAYDEFRKTAFELVGVCCPDCRWFPRHLMLGKALQPETQPSVFRHHFIPSPIMNQQKELYNLVRLYFRRLVKLVEEMNLAVGEYQEIKVTPSAEFSQPISDRSIPFYYNVNDASQLHKLWSFNKTVKHQANTVLSYHANNYNLSDLFVKEPTFWEYKKYDFLRIEGHVGKKYEDVLSNVMGLRERLNLPIKVVGVKLSQRFQNTNVDVECHFDDLENLFRMFVMELSCELTEVSDYFRSFNIDFSGENWQQRLLNLRGKTSVPGTTSGSEKPVELLGDQPIGKDKSGKSESDEVTKLSSGLRTNIDKTGEQIKLKGSQSGGFFKNIGLMIENINVSTGQSIYNMLWNKFAIGEFDFLPREVFVQVILYPAQIVEQIEVLLNMSKEKTLEEIDIDSVITAIQTLTQTAESYKTVIEENINNPDYQEIGNERIILYRLDKLIHQCNLRKLAELYSIYLQRIKEVKQLNLFARFAKDHPGMEHMAGVPKGGTFVIVYADNNEKAAELKPKDVVDILTRRPGFLSTASGASASYRNVTSGGRASGFRKAGGTGNEIRESDAATNISHNVGNVGSANYLSNQNWLASGFNQLSYLNQMEQLGPRDDLWGKVEPKDDLPPDNIVIADFALPYLCCGSCPEIATMVVSQIVFSLDETVYCKQDNSEYHFKTDPAGGQISGPGVGPSQFGYEIIFNPSNVPVPDNGIWQENIQLTYIVNNQTVVLNISVYNPVLTDFNAKQNDESNNGTVIIDFTYDYKNADYFELSLKNEILESGLNPPQQLTFENVENGDTLDFTFKVKKGNCDSDSISQSVIVELAQEVEFEINRPHVCNDFSGNVYFTTVPEPDNEHQVILKSPVGIKITMGSDINGHYFKPLNLGAGDLIFTYRGLDRTIHIGAPLDFSISIELVTQDGPIYYIKYEGENQADIASIKWALITGNEKTYLPEHENQTEFEITINQQPLPEGILAQVTSIYECFSEESEPIPGTTECFNFDVLLCWMEYMTQNFNFDPIEAAINSRENLEFTGEIPTDINNLLQDLRTSGSCGFSDKGNYYDFEDGCLYEKSSRKSLLDCIIQHQGEIISNYDPNYDYNKEELREFILEYQRSYCCQNMGLYVAIDPNSVQNMTTGEKTKVLKARGYTKLANKSNEELTVMINNSASGNKFSKNELELFNKKTLETILKSKGIGFSGGDKKRDLINRFGK